MKEMLSETIAATMRGFCLPRYGELPEDGLYLEQTCRYISDLLSPLENANLTASMISNYVKKDILANPVRKQYFRDHIAYLIFIAVAKTVLSLENIHALIRAQQRTYSNQVAYDYFCAELENILAFVFGFKDTIDAIGEDATKEKVMLRSTIIAIAYKAYLDYSFAEMREAE